MTTPDYIRLDREEAGLRQLVEAIKLFRAGRYECAITLAGAAEDMFLRSSSTAFEFLKNAPPPIDRPRNAFAAATADERGDMLNAVRNWLKHTREPEVRDITWLDASLMLTRAFTRAYTLKLSVSMPDWAVEPMNWFIAHGVDREAAARGD